MDADNLIGRIGTIDSERGRLRVRVTVKATKIAYGRTCLLVVPVEGEGEAWIDEGRFKRGPLMATMESEADPVSVVFRQWPDGECIALFPDESADMQGNCSSYMHTGQHGAANYAHVISATRASSADESRKLRQELESIGYLLLEMTAEERASY